MLNRNALGLKGTGRRYAADERWTDSLIEYGWFIPGMLSVEQFGNLYEAAEELPYNTDNAWKPHDNEERIQKNGETIVRTIADTPVTPPEALTQSSRYDAGRQAYYLNDRMKQALDARDAAERQAHLTTYQ
jgi:hypothetical protein